MVGSVFAIVLLLILVLGVVQVALSLYARNVLITSAHEGARAAVELTRSPDEGEAVARRTIERAAGGLVQTVDVRAQSFARPGERIMQVHVRARLRPLGVVPVVIPVSVAAWAARPDEI